MMENIKEIPYGIANFVEVAEQNCHFHEVGNAIGDFFYIFHHCFCCL